MTRTRVFISYSHLDKEWRERLETHLAVLAQKGLVDIWADTRIGVGDAWKDTIDTELASCQVAILLVSANFLSSKFIQEEEVRILLERHETTGGLVIVPVIARPCAWRLVNWLAERQCRPEGGRALSQGTESQVDLDLALLTYELGMRIQDVSPRVAEEMASLALVAPTESEPSKGPAAATPSANGSGLVGRSWSGIYRPSGRSMYMTVENVEGDRVSGVIRWDNTELRTPIEGTLLNASTADPSAWGDILARARNPLFAMRFVALRQEGPGTFELGGDYRAIIQADLAIIGLWYRNGTVAAIGEFTLTPADDAVIAR